MSENFTKAMIVFWLLALTAPTAAGQKLVCKAQALKARRPIPELKYECNEDLADYADEVLTQPDRRRAIDLYAKALERLAFSDWWATPVEDLNLCDFRRKAGALSTEEKRRYEDGEYYFSLLGFKQYRVVVAKDPCYQTGFGGSNIFLLNRVRGRVYSAEIIDGFFSRADNPLRLNYAMLGKETIFEIATWSGGLYPTETYYYFTIDPRTNRAVPKMLFKDNGKMTNRIYSDMILGEPEEYGLPKGSESLRIIKNHQLTKSFYVFEDTLEAGESENHKFIRVIFRWNGKFFE